MIELYYHQGEKSRVRNFLSQGTKLLTADKKKVYLLTSPAIK